MKFGLSIRFGLSMRLILSIRFKKYTYCCAASTDVIATRKYNRNWSLDREALIAQFEQASFPLRS